MKKYVDVLEYAKWTYFHLLNDTYVIWLLTTLTSLSKVIWERAASRRAVGSAVLRSSVHSWICKLPVGGGSGCYRSTGSRKVPLVTMTRPKCAPKRTSSRGPIAKPHYLHHPWTRPTYIWCQTASGSDQPFLPERNYVTFGSLLSQFRLSSVTLVHPTQGLNFSVKFLHRCVRWPSSDLRAKFYGDSPRGTPPLGALNARGVSK